MKDETGWLIERYDDAGRAMWWEGQNGITSGWPGDCWTYDNLKAVRFCREVDATRVARTVSGKASEHMWCVPREYKTCIYHARMAGECACGAWDE